MNENHPPNTLTSTELKKLVDASKSGDSDAFGELYDSLYGRVYAYAYRRVFDRQTAEDITAVVFYRIMRTIRTFNWRHEGGYYAWMFRITSHEIARYFRLEGRYTLPEDWLSVTEMVSDERPSQDEVVAQDERCSALQRSLKKLPSKLREVVELYYFARLPHAVIAEALNISEGTTRVRLHRGLEKLQEIMRGEGYEY